MVHIKDRLRGVLYGQLIGDALGARYEFQSAELAAANIKADSIDEHLPILGGGKFNVAPGQITDDSELALCLAYTLYTYGYNIRKIADAYANWYHSGPFDIGFSIRNAFAGSSPTAYENNTIMSRNAVEMNANSKSNGNLMRISPLAIYIAHTSINAAHTKNASIINTVVSESGTHNTGQMQADFIGMIMEECGLTHSNPVAMNAAIVYICAIRMAIISGDRRRTYDSALQLAQIIDGEVYGILNAARDTNKVHIKTAQGVEHVRADSRQAGYLGIALQNAFYELLHGHSFEESMRRIISLGGDTDTNAAIAGALLGAIYGASRIDISITTKTSRMIALNETHCALSGSDTDESLDELVQFATLDTDQIIIQRPINEEWMRAVCSQPRLQRCTNIANVHAFIEEFIAKFSVENPEETA